MSLTSTAALAKDKRNATNVPDMQHRHFAFIAGIIAQIKDAEDRHAIAHETATHLHCTNQNFNKARFLAACDVGQIGHK